MSTTSSFWTGLTAAIFGIMLSIILFIAVGLPAEQLLLTFETTPYNGGTVFTLSAPWDMAYDDVSFWMTLLYVVMILPGLLGIIVMFMSAIKTQTYDVFADQQQQEYVPTSGQITPEEIAFRRFQ